MQQLPKTLSSFIWHMIKKWPFSFTVFFIAPCFLVLETTVIPYILKLLVDVIVKNQASRGAIFHEVVPLLQVGAGVWVSLVVLFRLQHGLQAFILPKFEANIRLQALEYVTKHSYQYFSDQLSGRLANKISDLVNSIQAIRHITSWTIIATAATTLAALIALSTITTHFTLILMVWIAFHLAVTAWCVPKLTQIAKNNAEDKSVLSGVIVDVLSNIIPVKLFARQKSELQYVGQVQAQEARSNQKMIASMNAFILLQDIMVTVMLGFMIYYLIDYWRMEKISTGDFVFTFNITFTLMHQMWWLSTNLSEFFGHVGKAQQALSLIQHPHDIKDAADATELDVSAGEIQFIDVGFHYGEENKLFNNKNVCIKPGQKVGLVGFSGSGKTTFINLIMRFFDVESGGILIDKQNIATVTQESLRRNIAMIPQDTTLFHRTIMENIRYGRENAGDEEVIEAAKLAHCHEFITELPNGYDTLVGERGIKLSGGQRQRIAIARAMLKDAPILLLDEATSSLDSVTEKLIQDSLKHLMHAKTTLVIAHRLSTLASLDRILVLDNGQVIEDGSHDELISLNGHYAKLWQMQVGGFLPEHEDGEE